MLRESHDEVSTASLQVVKSECHSKETQLNSVQFNRNRKLIPRQLQSIQGTDGSNDLVSRCNSIQATLKWWGKFIIMLWWKFGFIEKLGRVFFGFFGGGKELIVG